ncbi:flagellar basal-body MS-ring/collar protein FliF [Caballeronia sp. LP006]|uniref:flagellar basal-body MS-ring/collar protein FliF n=1 Tax=unclassified Caballeronia TaxID=2646786 RepID=UPI001FD549E4|nr:MULTISPECIES: flagellar basal-body MS-ring/collar protein FliF [unclassified Caballeronia]MDR5772849.1 flagellar basal-body MS-ring/collar protein FliF [Caballeronia sp. LZ002]MDR5803692.1 flagellar basal-body MS-ring/collar protein FliF [Caballeronia sp. LZ001]MDR5829743.1 flagellar basal-body MS-ring/collar protein FliF [Caballeronia sp. LP006]MDR5848283.1 flagellar basal-body MS-ring/collar protein FliF [Caballeronia sp. LZ003]
MDTPNNSLITPDARMGLAGAQPGASASAASPSLTGGAGGADFGGFAQRMPMLSQFRSNPRVPLIIAVAILAMVVAGLVMWTRQPDYRVLFSNLSDRDGGAIVAALQQGNIPYKLSDGGGAILVPAESVHETRLRLASQGLPKSGSVGFELMDNQKFGISQFAEQINYQRALEGELERTIGAISSVKSARVHLAIPKPSVFVRDKELPTASVMVNLFPGRVLDEGQVSAIAHMVSSGVADMPVKNVNIVDQDGNLLTNQSAANGLDASQLKYVQQIEHNTQKRIDAILSPLFGGGNAHSQVSADIDFSKLEQTAESYGPNANPQNTSIRSQQSSESSETSGSGPSGVPGALSNQPPQPASAPVTGGASDATGAAAAKSTPQNLRKDTTTNYEVDRTVRHYEQATGGIKRLSVAVVVNYQRQVDAKGNVTMTPLAADKLAQVQQLVKDAMGYDEKRGDSVNVVNSAFNSDQNVTPDVPWWRTPDMIMRGIQLAKYVGIGIVALFLYFSMVKPAMRRAFPVPEPAAPSLNAPDELSLLDGPTLEGGAKNDDDDKDAEVSLLGHESNKAKFDRNLDYARMVARQDARIVATVVKNWVSDER